MTTAHDPGWETAFILDPHRDVRQEPKMAWLDKPRRIRCQGREDVALASSHPFPHLRYNLGWPFIHTQTHTRSRRTGWCQKCRWAGLRRIWCDCLIQKEELQGAHMRWNLVSCPTGGGLRFWYRPWNELDLEIVLPSEMVPPYSPNTENVSKVRIQQPCPRNWQRLCCFPSWGWPTYMRLLRRCGKIYSYITRPNFNHAQVCQWYLADGTSYRAQAMLYSAYYIRIYATTGPALLTLLLTDFGYWKEPRWSVGSQKRNALISNTKSVVILPKSGVPVPDTTSERQNHLHGPTP